MIVAILSPPAIARAETFTGKVTDLSGNPLYGAGVTLATADVATGTAADGTWSLATVTTGISVRPVATSTSATRHLVLDGNRIRLQFDGVDGAGRTSNANVGAQNFAPLRTVNRDVAARSAAAVVDTLLFSWNGRVRARVPTTSFTSGATQEIDTSTTSADIPWTSGITYGTLADSRDGQVYKTVSIGTQTWMAQNLNYKVDSSWCYANSTDSCSKYGRLYQWASVMGLDTSYNNKLWSGTLPHQGICPSGWHVPSDTEWTILTTYIGGEDSAGTKLKSTNGWNISGNGTDTCGFRVLPAGVREYFDGLFVIVGNYSYFWSASENDVEYDWSRDFSLGTPYVIRGIEVKAVSRGYDVKAYGYSLRCLED